MAKENENQLIKHATVGSRAVKSKLAKLKERPDTYSLNSLSHKGAKNGVKYVHGKNEIKEIKFLVDRMPRTGEVIKVSTRKGEKFRDGNQANDLIPDKQSLQDQQVALRINPHDNLMLRQIARDGITTKQFKEFVNSSSFPSKQWA